MRRASLLCLHSVEQPLEYCVDPREAALRALLDAVLHRRVALLGRLEAHRLGQLRLLTKILELQRLQVILERLHEALGWVDLMELALDDAVRSAEPPAAAGADVHLLDDRAVAPPFGDQLRIRPDGEDVPARRVEDPLDADLELVRGADGGGVHRSPFVRSTTCAGRRRRTTSSRGSFARSARPRRSCSTTRRACSRRRTRSAASSRWGLACSSRASRSRRRLLAGRARLPRATAEALLPRAPAGRAAGRPRRRPQPLPSHDARNADDRVAAGTV